MKNLFFVLILSLGFSLRAQHPDIIEGDFSDLAMADSVNLQFHFEGMSLGKYYRETDWLRMLADQIDSIDNIAEMRTQWLSAQDSFFVEAFTQGLQQGLQANGPVMEHALDKAPLTLIVRTAHIDPALKEEMAPASLHLEYILVNSSTQRIQLGRYYHKGISGREHAKLYQRIANAYQAAGNAFAEAVMTATTTH